MVALLKWRYRDVLFLIGYLLSIACGQDVSAPIQITSVQVVPDKHFTKVSVTYTSPKTTEVTWTVDDGFSLTALNPSTTVSFQRHGVNNTNVASITIPRELTFQVLKLHIVCGYSSFQIHAEFGISHSTPTTFETIDQYTVIVPRESEIGISSRGETRFHVFANTTGSIFFIGIIQAEAHFVDSASPEVNSTTAYSFLPGIWTGGLRIEPLSSTKTEYHADILLNHSALQKTGGVISIAAACTATGSLITRLDMKQTLFLHSRPGSSAVPMNSLAYVKEVSPKTIITKKSDSVVLRCTFFGNPSPRINLFRKNGLSLEKSNIPSYMTSLPFESAVVFQFLNVTEKTSGDYVCKASSGDKSIQREHTISIQQ